MKKIYITLVVLITATIAMAYLYFSNLNTKAAANDLSLNTATANTAIVFSFDNEKSFYEILDGQDLFERILGRQKSNQLSAIKENLAQATQIYNETNGQKVYVSLLAGQNNNIDFLISTQTKTTIDLQKAIKNNIKTTAIGKLYQVQLNDSTTCFLSVKDNLILISNTENAIYNALTFKNTSNQNFVNYIKANSLYTKNSLANLFVDFNTVPSLLKNILNTNLSGELSVFDKQDAFATLNYNFSKDKLLLTGTTEIKKNNYYNLFSNIGEQKIFIDAILSEKTANYTLFTIKDYVSWRKALDKLRTNETTEIEQNITKIQQNYGIDLTKIFTTYFKNQFISFQLKSGEKLAALALTNGEKANQLLLDLSTEYKDPIRIFKEDKIPYYFFGTPFKNFKKPFYVIIDNYLVMANNASSIESFLNDYQNNKLLVNDKNYINLKNQLSPLGTISFYVSNSNSNSIFGKNIKPIYDKQYQSKLGLNKFSAFCYQLSGDNGKFLTNFLLTNFLEKPNQLDSLSK